MTEEETLIARRALLALVPASLLAGAAAEAQQAEKIQPDSYRVVLENDRVKILEYVSRPGMGICGMGVHSHPAHLTVLLTNAKARVKEGGKTLVVENRLGDVFWSEASTHEVENITGRDVRALLIELKGPQKA